MTINDNGQGHMEMMIMMISIELYIDWTIDWVMEAILELSSSVPYYYVQYTIDTSHCYVHVSFNGLHY